MLNLKTEMAGAMAALVVTGGIDSSSDVLYSATQKFNKICYVTINKPYHTFSTFFKVNGIDPQKVFFIDGVTKTTIKNPKKDRQVLFVPPADYFKSIEKAIRKVLQQQHPDLLIFDSLSSLLIFEQEATVIRFSHGLAAMVKGFQNKSVFIVLEKDAGLGVAQNIGMQMDKTIYII